MNKFFLAIYSVLLPLLLLPADTLAASNVIPVTVQQQEIWLMEDDSLPLLAMQITFRGAGATADPQGKDGMALLLSEMLLRGAGKLDSLAFKKELEEKAINISFDVDKDNFIITLKTLKEHRQRALELLQLCLTRPRLDRQQFTLAKAQMQASLRRKLEDPNYLAALNWNQLVYGNHPYARPLHGSPESLDAIQLSDLRPFLKNILAADNMTISAVGDTNQQDITTLLTPFIASLPEKSHLPEIADFPVYPQAATRTVTHDIPQSVVMFGHGGISLHDPDYYAAAIANYTLGGGGFESRLMQEIREKNGLAYSVSTYLHPLGHTDLFKGSLATRQDAVATSIELLRQEIAHIRQDGITQKELDAAKNYLTASMLLSLDSTDNIAAILNFAQLEGLGTDFIANRDKKIRAATLEQVNTVAKRLFTPEKLSIVVVGKEE